VVLFTSYSGKLGGAERLLLEFAGAVHGEVFLGCPEGELAGAARERGLRVFPLRGRALVLRASPADRALAPFRLAAFAHDLRQLARDLDPELLVAWGMRSAVAALLPRPATRPVVFFHNDLLPGPAIAQVVRAAAARADLVCAPSLTVARDLDPAGHLGERLTVTPPGVDVDRFAASDPPAQPPEVLVLGALVGWKRPDLALDAFALIRARFPQARLRLVGGPITPEDPLPAALRIRAGRPDLEGAVEFAGEVVDPRPDLARATCLLHCAPREPFGIAVLEALAAGRPAVVPAAAGPAEIVDPSCGLLYPPGQAAAAADAIAELLADPERAALMGAGGQARARERFDRAAARRRFASGIEPVRAPTATRAAPALAAEQLALVTVTHDSAPELRALLRSVARHLPGARVVVVDCASGDDSVRVAQQYDQTVTIALDENIGFGRACNVGIEAVSEPVTVLVNPDVELIDDSLLAAAAEAARTYGQPRLVAPLVLSPDGSRQDSVHPRPGSGPALLHALLPPAVVRPRVALASAPWKAIRPLRVGWAVGCVLAAQTGTLRRLGPFDERIFLFGEDLDLGLRAAAAGVETWFCPQARVIHHQAHSTGRAFGGEPFELLARRRRGAIVAAMGPHYARLDDAAQALTFASRMTLKRVLGHNAERERRQLEALGRARRPT
jgi:N-acetylglucosaminyl-diphospho-decaprenol L-rhamnosyltransferase